MNRDQKHRATREKRRAEYRAKHKPGKKAADPRWNTDKEQGREVSIYEVSLYALDGHEKCRKNPGMVGPTALCSCAQRRFFAKNKGRVIFDAQARVWWIKGKEPNAQKVAVEPPAAAKGPEDEA